MGKSLEEKKQEKKEYDHNRYWSNVEKSRKYSRKRSQRWRDNNPEKARESSRKYKKNNPEKVKETRRMHNIKHRKEKTEYQKNYRKENPEKTRDLALKNKYGSSIEEYKELAKIQNDRCFICNKKEFPLCMDHNHKTKKVRGLLCKRCNIGLGHFYDSPKLFSIIIYYLNNPPAEKGLYMP